MPFPSLLRAQPASWLALIWLLLLVATGLLAPWLALPDATPDLLHVTAPPAYATGGPAHYLGTDILGRDVLVVLVAGAQRLVLLTLPAVAVATAAGAAAGAAAGFWGNQQLRLPVAAIGWGVAAAWRVLALPYAEIFFLLLGAALLLSLATYRASYLAKRRVWYFTLPLDSLVLSIITLLGAVPRLILLVALAAGPPPTTLHFIGLLALLAWPETARLVRGQMLKVRAQPFIEAARASGLPAGRIWWRHALPHACLPLLAFAPLSLAGLVGLESTLSFLGIGSGPDVASWGGLLATVRQSPSAWWVAVVPGLALLLTLLSLQKLAGIAAEYTTR